MVKKNKSWDERFEELVQFQQINGHTRVPQALPGLGRWVKNQKLYYKKFQTGKKCILTDERISKLTDLGFDFDSQEGKNHEIWLKHYEELRQFYIANGHTRVPQNVPGLGLWVRTQRGNYKKFKAGEKCSITNDRISKLNDIDFDFGSPDIKKTWDERFEELCLFHQTYGHVNVPSQQTGLSEWLSHQRQYYKKFKAGEKCCLTDERVSKLVDIGYEIDGVKERFSWEERMEQLKKYREEHGHLLVPCHDTELGNFVKRQRVHYKKYKNSQPTSMNESRIKDLEGLGFSFNVHHRDEERDTMRESWDENFEELLQFYQKNGHVRVPPSLSELDIWLKNQKHNYKRFQAGKKSSLTDDRISKLTDVGFDFYFVKSTTPKDDKKWTKRFNQLVKYKRKHGTCEVPSTYKKKLYSWVSKQHKEYKRRKKFKPSRLTPEKIQQLINLEFKFIENVKKVSWKKRMKHLKKYKKKHGHLKIPHNDPKLGAFIQHQEDEYKEHLNNNSTTMTESKIKDLEKLGFVFSAREKTVPCDDTASGVSEWL